MTELETRIDVRATPDARAILKRTSRAVLLAANHQAPTVVMSSPQRDLAFGTPPPTPIGMEDQDRTLVRRRADGRQSAPAVAKRTRRAPRLPNVPTDRPEIFALVRRIVLQRDLESATGLLHLEAGALLRARVVLALVDEHARITCPIAADLRAATKHVDLAKIVACAQHRRPYADPRTIMIALDTQRSAVLIACRADGMQDFDAVDQRLALAIASRLDLLDQVLALDNSRRAQEAADHATIFRPEALRAARDPQRAGELVHLAPRVVTFAIPALLILTVLLVVAAAIVQVPTYSRGTVVITMNGHNVISSSAGRIATVHVVPGQRVSAGDPLLTLDTTRERQELEQVETVYRDQLSTFLFDPTDDAARQSLAGILAQRKGALDRLELMTITAPVDGQVSAILASDLVQQGEHVATITPANAEASVIAFLPGSDRSRIHPGMTLQVELSGYASTRVELTITEVGTEVMGASTARKLLGQKLADGVVLPPLVVIVKAKLPGPTFEAEGKTYNYFDGMDGLAEIEVDSKSFLSVVIPTGD